MVSFSFGTASGQTSDPTPPTNAESKQEVTPGKEPGSDKEASSEQEVAPKPTSSDASSGESEAANGLNESATDDRRLEELLELVSDNTFRIHKREMPAYWMLLDRSNRKPLKELLEEAKANPRFHDFYTAPSKHRGELVKIDLNARRVIPYPIEVENPTGAKQLYEIWGWTDEAKAWLYCCVTSELPEGFPTSGDVMKKVTLVGYFFKLQAYQPGDAAPNAKPLVAPLLLGRVDWRSDLGESPKGFPNWPLYLIIGFGVLVIFRVLMQFRSLTKPSRTRSMYRRRSLEPIDTDAMAFSLRGDDSPVAMAEQANRSGPHGLATHDERST